MKILVPVKQVLDPALKPNVSGSSLDTQGMKQVINPFDEVALEEALRLKEKGVASEIIAVSIGSMDKPDALRTAFALGADRGICVKSEAGIQSLSVAKILKGVAEKEGVKLILMGKQSSDSDMGTAGQMLAALMGWPQATAISKFELSGDKVNATRELDNGSEQISMSLPCVVTCDLQLNNPRFATLPNIMKARKKEVEMLNASDLCSDMSAHYKVVGYTTPAPKKGAEMLGSVDEFIAKLQAEVDKI